MNINPTGSWSPSKILQQFYSVTFSQKSKTVLKIAVPIILMVGSCFLYLFYNKKRSSNILDIFKDYEFNNEIPDCINNNIINVIWSEKTGFSHYKCQPLFINDNSCFQKQQMFGGLFIDPTNSKLTDEIKKFQTDFFKTFHSKFNENKSESIDSRITQSMNGAFEEIWANDKSINQKIIDFDATITLIFNKKAYIANIGNTVTIKVNQYGKIVNVQSKMMNEQLLTIEYFSLRSLKKGHLLFGNSEFFNAVKNTKKFKISSDISSDRLAKNLVYHVASKMDNEKFKGLSVLVLKI